MIVVSIVGILAGDRDSSTRTTPSGPSDGGISLRTPEDGVETPGLRAPTIRCRDPAHADNPSSNVQSSARMRHRTITVAFACPSHERTLGYFNSPLVVDQRPDHLELPWFRLDATFRRFAPVALAKAARPSCCKYGKTDYCKPLT